VTISVFGASGHTGRFVAAELRRRAVPSILSGRDPDRLARLYPDDDRRPASVDDPASLDAALAGADAVVNCAGPFADTHAPVLDAALRNGIPYLDVTAELEVVAEILARYDGPARAAGVTVVPAMAFFGAVGDLLATAATAGWPAADRIDLAYALSDWRPTDGTRATGRVSAGRRDGRRLRYADGRLGFGTGAAPTGEWAFPAPVGTLPVVGEFATADSVTIPHHLSTKDIGSWMHTRAAEDLRSADPTPPTAVDSEGRSAQTFLVEVVARRGDEERRAAVSGRDIYAVTAPLVVEAALRVVKDPVPGAHTAGALFDPGDLLGATLTGSG
jgi:short subunit dehydrogenase-like uncharacterized protein